MFVDCEKHKVLRKMTVQTFAMPHQYHATHLTLAESIGQPLISIIQSRCYIL